MAIKPPVKTIEEAFNSSCKKNGISTHKRKISRTSMPIRDENGEVFIISEDLSIRKRATINPSKKKESKSPVEKTEIVSPIISVRKKKSSRKNTRLKTLVKV